MKNKKEEKTEKTTDKTLDLTLADITKKYGEGTIMRFSDKPVADVSVISTTSPSLDAATGIGGLPRGRIVEIIGVEAGGKTTLALHVTAEAQKAGGVVAYVDAEHSLDPEYAKNLGVDIDQLLISQPSSGEQALEITEALIRSNKVALIVIDSVAALVPRAELDGEMGDSLPGLQARLMSQAMRKLTAIVAQSNTCLIFINQIRSTIGVSWGSNEVGSGGRALKFYASMRLDIRRIGAIKDGDEITGNRTRIKIIKNKLAAPFKETEIDIIYGQGISREADLLDMAVTHNVVDKSGMWYSYKSNRIGQGREKSKQFLKDNPSITQEIEEDLKKVNTKI